MTTLFRFIPSGITAGRMRLTDFVTGTKKDSDHTVFFFANFSQNTRNRLEHRGFDTCGDSIEFSRMSMNQNINAMKTEIITLDISDNKKCGSIWDMQRHRDFAEQLIHEMLNGNRTTNIYTVDNEFVGCGAALPRTLSRHLPKNFVSSLTSLPTRTAAAIVPIPTLPGE